MLRCVECNSTSAAKPEVGAPKSEISWLTFSVAEPDRTSERFIVTYCSTCLQREFGGVPCQFPSARSA